MHYSFYCDGLDHAVWTHLSVNWHRTAVFIGVFLSDNSKQHTLILKCTSKCVQKMWQGLHIGVVFSLRGDLKMQCKCKLRNRCENIMYFRCYSHCCAVPTMSVQGCLIWITETASECKLGKNGLHQTKLTTCCCAALAKKKKKRALKWFICIFIICLP